MNNLNIIKEKISTYGNNTISDMELLSILLGKNIIDMFAEKSINNLDDLLNLSELDLINIKNLGRTKYKIKAFIELYNRKLKYTDISSKMSMPKDIFESNLDMSLYDQEVLRVLCLNTKNKLLYKEDIFKGSLNTSIVHPREIFKTAINKNSASIIICHNHPSGDPTPSREDINITLRIKECGDIIGIKLIDHIVIGKNKFVSLKERGLM